MAKELELEIAPLEKRVSDILFLARPRMGYLVGNDFGVAFEATTPAATAPKITKMQTMPKIIQNAL